MSGQLTKEPSDWQENFDKDDQDYQIDDFILNEAKIKRQQWLQQKEEYLRREAFLEE